MQSFRTELENPIVERDIIELEKKIFEFKNLQIDEQKFRSLRLARGVYGQRQFGVQMIRIKLPYGKVSSKQLRRIAGVSDEFSNGNLHITTRQDIQIHHVSLDRTPELWAELEKDEITLREACGNTVRNVTASDKAGIDIEEQFDITPYAHAFFEYFLRNPICQDMGRKIKVSFSSSEKDDALSFIHDLGFIPVLKDGKHAFKVLIGGGIGSQPKAAHVVHEALDADQLIPFSEAVIRVFDRRGERNKRNKARLKFLIESEGVEQFLQWVEEETNALPYTTYPIEYKEEEIRSTNLYNSSVDISSKKYQDWIETNVFEQKQKGLFAVGIPVVTGDFSSDTARKLADIIDSFCGSDLRLSIGQSILLKSIQKENLPALYQALNELGFTRIGFHKINDITSCPGTSTCNLGIGSSMGLANELQSLIENDYSQLIQQRALTIKISGCMNGCGQHTIANIGFQGMTLKAGERIAPATQILLGGGVLSNGKGRFADKVLKTPSKRVPEVLRWILNDFTQNTDNNTLFTDYYDQKGTDYFYQNLKKFSSTEDLVDSDFIDWGNDQYYKKEIGIGECAGVTIDLVQTLIFDAQESFELALESLENKSWSDSIYHSYATQIRAAKALLTKSNSKINTHESIIESFDEVYPEFKNVFQFKFQDLIRLINTNKPTELFAKAYSDQAKLVLSWIKEHTNVN